MQLTKIIRAIEGFFSKEIDPSIVDKIKTGKDENWIISKLAGFIRNEVSQLRTSTSTHYKDVEESMKASKEKIDLVIFSSNKPISIIEAKFNYEWVYVPNSKTENLESKEAGEIKKDIERLKRCLKIKTRLFLLILACFRNGPHEFTEFPDYYKRTFNDRTANFPNFADRLKKIDMTVRRFIQSLGVQDIKRLDTPVSSDTNFVTFIVKI